MNALSYLIRKQTKNFFRNLVRHPSKLIIYLFAVVFFVMMIVTSQKTPQKSSGYTDIRMLEGIFLGWLLLFSAPILFNSLKSGTTMFSMSDVDLLFVSPISPKNILFYGLVKQTAATLFGFVFILFYSGTLMSTFHISAWDVIWLLLSSALVVIMIQMISLLLYSYSNGNARRKNAIRTVLFACFAVLAFSIVSVCLKNGGGVGGLYAAFDSPLINAFPFIGWVTGAVFALFRGNTGAAVFWFLITAAGFLLVLALFLHSDADYYEDVLQTTEVMYEAKQSAKGNRPMTSQNVSRKKVNIKKTGLGKGWGADTFFYKHLCEARRRSRLVFLGRSSFVILAADLVIAFLALRSSGKDAPSTTDVMMILLGINVYILFLTNAAGDWMRELSKPYIYLVPANPFRKLIWASMTTALKPVAEGVLFFAVATAAIRAPLLAGLACFLAYSSFGLLFLAGNILSRRVFGGIANRGVILFLYLFLLLLLMAPGVAGGVMIFNAMPSAASEALRFFLGSLPAVGWNLIISCILIYCCRNLLANTEAN